MHEDYRAEMLETIGALEDILKTETRKSSFAGYCLDLAEMYGYLGDYKWASSYALASCLYYTDVFIGETQDKLIYAFEIMEHMHDSGQYFRSYNTYMAIMERSDSL